MSPTPQVLAAAAERAAEYAHQKKWDADCAPIGPIKKCEARSKSTALGAAIAMRAYYLDSMGDLLERIRARRAAGGGEDDAAITSLRDTYYHAYWAAHQASEYCGVPGPTIDARVSEPDLEDAYGHAAPAPPRFYEAVEEAEAAAAAEMTARQDADGVPPTLRGDALKRAVEDLGAPVDMGPRRDGVPARVIRPINLNGRLVDTNAEGGPGADPPEERGGGAAAPGAA